MSRPVALACITLALSCSGPPHAADEAAVTYRAAFTSEAGVKSTVVFPFPEGALQLLVQQGITVSDGGTAQVETSPEGIGLALEGRGRVEAQFTSAKVTGLGERGMPEAVLSRPVPDGGVGDRYLKVNKGGSALVPVEFEFTAERDCGGQCGGRRSWSFTGPVGLSLQEVPMAYFEESKR